MPTFDFACKNCGAVFEYSRPFGSKTVPTCPKCKSKRTEKQLSTPAIVFKGAGWYKTDSRPVPKAKTAETPAKEAATDTGGATKDATPPSPATSDTATDASKKPPKKEQKPL